MTSEPREVGLPSPGKGKSGSQCLEENASISLSVTPSSPALPCCRTPSLYYLPVTLIPKKQTSALTLGTPSNPTLPLPVRAMTNVITQSLTATGSGFVGEEVTVLIDKAQLLISYIV